MCFCVVSVCEIVGVSVVIRMVSILIRLLIFWR